MVLLLWSVVGSLLGLYPSRVFDGVSILCSHTGTILKIQTRVLLDYKSVKEISQGPMLMDYSGRISVGNINADCEVNGIHKDVYLPCDLSKSDSQYKDQVHAATHQPQGCWS